MQGSLYTEGMTTNPYSPRAMLIIRAAVLWRDARDAGDRTKRATVRDAQLDAFSQVAADIMDFASTPEEFREAVIGAVRAIPWTLRESLGRDEALAVRQEWKQAVADHAARALA
jgi:hypothetical protein